MHPNVFLKTFWRMALRPEVFVAMPFSGDFRNRYNDVIAPAISSLYVNGMPLKPFRVDNSKTGDSILTEIMDGIAHCQLVLADVSTIGKDSKTSQSYRNGNVMYEVGIALACRNPQEVLLIRDDKDKFLFDVSTIPHMHLDFTDVPSATNDLRDALSARLKEQQFINDARIVTAVSTLTGMELNVLRQYRDAGLGQSLFIPKVTLGSVPTLDAFGRLLDKRIICLNGFTGDGTPAYTLTAFGISVMTRALSTTPVAPSTGAYNANQEPELLDKGDGSTEITVQPR